MIPTPITDHADQAVDRLIEHYSGESTKRILYGLIRTYSGQIQELEDALWSVIYGRLLDPAPGQTAQAEGVQLGVLGKLVGCAREGYSDPEYRLAIRLQIRVNRSFGTGEDLLEIVRLAIGPSALMDRYREEYYHVTYFGFDGITTVLAKLLYRVLQRSRAAGYRVLLEYYTDRIDPSRLLRLSWAGDLSVGANGLGWSGDASRGGLATCELG